MCVIATNYNKKELALPLICKNFYKRIQLCAREIILLQTSGLGYFFYQHRSAIWKEPFSQTRPKSRCFARDSR